MYNRPFTPEWITELKPNEIFVFGSNLASARAYDIQNIILPEDFVEVMRRDIHFPGMVYNGTYAAV